MLHDLADVIGEPLLRQLPAPPGNARNQRLSARGMALVDLRNRFLEALRPGLAGTRWLRVEAVARALGGPDYVLPDAVVRKVRRRSAKDVAWLARQLAASGADGDDAEVPPRRRAGRGRPPACQPARPADRCGPNRTVGRAP